MSFHFQERDLYFFSVLSMFSLEIILISFFVLIIHVIHCSNMFLKGYPLEAKTAPKN